MRVRDAWVGWSQVRRRRNDRGERASRAGRAGGAGTKPAKRNPPFTASATAVNAVNQPARERGRACGPQRDRVATAAQHDGERVEAADREGACGVVQDLVERRLSFPKALVMDPRARRVDGSPASGGGPETPATRGDPSRTSAPSSPSALRSRAWSAARNGSPSTSAQVEATARQVSKLGAVADGDERWRSERRSRRSAPHHSWRSPSCTPP